MPFDSEEHTTFLAVILVLLIAGTVACSIWVIASAMEASAFNQITGSHVTTWQAMWIELRVIR